MTNKSIARFFANLAAIMELHGENPFKIRSYANAYIVLRKVETPLSEMSRMEIEAIAGVGKNIADKIQELLATGDLATYRKYADDTPEGVVEMLQIKGFGPKKVLAVWKELEITTIGELLYACNENRLTELHGFGQKTQAEIQKNAEYYLQSKGKRLLSTAQAVAQKASDWLRQYLPDAHIEVVGELRRSCPIVEQTEILVAASDFTRLTSAGIVAQDALKHFTLHLDDETSVTIHACTPQTIGSKLFLHTATADFMTAFLSKAASTDFRNLATEAELFAKAQIPYLSPELRETAADLDTPESPTMLRDTDIRSVLHAHSTYSDGLNTLSEMAKFAQQRGYAFLGMTDHSKSAFYARGLTLDRLEAQWAEIDTWNSKNPTFRILKGIESDILNDGSLDYADEILQQFDFIIASVHSNLRMDEAKATARLLKAIENPYTTILGHPTGRLLLAREGYPIDHAKIIDACAANRVAIELNANPYRLDLDWRWIPYARQRGVKISVNPDAHSCEGILDLRYGVAVARKGRLEASECLNTLELKDFLAFAAKQ
jgi:DNA polymerase (family X)